MVMSRDLLSKSDLHDFQQALYMLSPGQYCVNFIADKAYKAHHPLVAKCICISEYFVTPIDRVIQLLAIPVISIINDIYDLRYQRIDSFNITAYIFKSIFNLIIRIVAYSLAILLNLSINILTGFKLYKNFIINNSHIRFFKARSLARRNTHTHLKLFFQLDF